MAKLAEVLVVLGNNEGNAADNAFLQGEIVLIGLVEGLALRRGDGGVGVVVQVILPVGRDDELAVVLLSLLLDLVLLG